MSNKFTDAGVQLRFVNAETVDDLRSILAETWEAGYREASTQNFPNYDEPAGLSRPWTDGDERNPYRRVGS